MVVGIDGGYVRDREGSWVRNDCWQGLGSFERNGAGDDLSGTPTDAGLSGRYFAFVQAFDDWLRRRMFEMLRGLGYRLNQKLIMLSDGGESVRTLGRRIRPEAEHVLDWFHVAMLVTALGQLLRVPRRTTAAAMSARLSSGTPSTCSGTGTRTCLCGWQDCRGSPRRRARA